MKGVWVPHDTRDQIVDYARRKDMDVPDIERWLAPVLGYDPQPAPAKEPTPA